MPPSRFKSFIVIAAVGIATLFLLSSSSREVASRAVQGAVDVPKAVKEKLYEYDVPGLRFSFPKSPHKPPVQRNSTVGDTSWHSDWRWLNPFSLFITWDSDRIVLPPLVERPNIYTYYDTTTKRDKQQKEADQKLLQTWKRSWWAQGFRPIVLTQAEATTHPLYQTLRGRALPKDLEFEFERWLAWGHMGTGLLASWHAFPMATYDDSLLTYLRRGQYDRLTRFESLGAGLFVGEKLQINQAIEAALEDVQLDTYKSIIEAIPKDRLKVEESDSIAHYDTSTINRKYARLSNLLLDDPLKGQQALDNLVNAHLHTVWQNTFSDGIRVLKPLPAHTSKLVEPAQHLAQLLTECPETMLQSSCPPNKPKCNPCVGARMTWETRPSFLNSTIKFTIATVPHPYTMITLNSLSTDITVRHIRRETERDTWIKQVTRDILGDGRGGPSRVVGLKSAVASEFSRSRGIWFTVEHFPADFTAPPTEEKAPTNDPHPKKKKITPFPEHWLEDLDWVFGFSIPRQTISHGESYNPIPGQGNELKGLPAEHKSSYEPNDPTFKEATTEVELLKKARETIKTKDEEVKKMLDVAMAWNLADAEVWKFVRAYSARSLMERKQWEEEEAAYSESSSSRGGRWL